MSTGDNHGLDELGELEQIFRAEALQHIKRLAELLFLMEEQGPTEDMQSEAFREAHNLKGSASLLGFDRVAHMTHRLEDVIGVIRRGGGPLSSSTMDLMLGGLDVIRESVEASRPGEQTLSSDEQLIVESLDQWLLAHSERVPQTGDASEAARADARAPITAGPSAKPTPTSVEADTFIRVTAASLDSLTAQVDDLFEAQVQVEGFGRELTRLRQGVNQLLHAVGALRATAPSPAATEAVDLAELLDVRLDSASGHFQRNMQGLSRRIRTAQEEVGRMGLATLDTLHVQLRRQVREVSRVTGKPVELRFWGQEYAVDRRVIEALTEPLVHLIRNAVDHGIEPAAQRRAAGKQSTAILEVRARHLGDAVELSITDDGRGIDLEAIRAALVASGRAASEVDELSDEQLADRLFESGFSTRTQVSEMSGRGVGLDVVKHTMDRVGGEVRLQTRAGQGTTVSLRLPLSMSTVRSLLVSVGGRTLAIPAANVQKVLILRPADLLEPGQGEVVSLGGQHVPVTSLHALLGLPVPPLGSDARRKAVVLQLGDRRWAVTVDDVVEYTQVIVKPLGDLLERVPNLSGLALLGDGELALMLNPGDLVRSAGAHVHGQAVGATASDPVSQGSEPVVLVVDDSIATRTLERTLLESAGYRVLTATDGYDALDVLASRHCDLVITDAQMPHMDGFELTRTLKSRAPLAHLPVIMITSLGSPEDIERGMASGADAYVVKKNLTQHELVSTITQLL